jgi:hypothetical protein
MKKYNIEVPVWLAFLELVMGVVFGAVWMYLAIGSGKILFILVGALFFAVFLIIAFYILATGRYPMRIRAR